jgi:hypothetical protein
MKKTVVIFLFLYSILVFSKTETDTITTWKLFKDSELIFEGNEFDQNTKIGTINLKVKFRQLKFIIIYDFFKAETNKTLEFIINSKVEKSFSTFGYSDHIFTINDDEVYDLFLKNGNKTITLKYYDKINTNGIIIGKLKIKV